MIQRLTKNIVLCWEMVHTHTRTIGIWHTLASPRSQKRNTVSFLFSMLSAVTNHCFDHTYHTTQSNWLRMLLTWVLDCSITLKPIKIYINISCTITLLHCSHIFLFISKCEWRSAELKHQTPAEVLSALRALRRRPVIPCDIQSTAHHFTSLTTVTHFPNNCARTVS